MDWIEQVLSRWAPGLLRIFCHWFGYRRRLFSRPPWRWNMAKQRWELTGSNGKGYICTESVIARIEGRAPRWEPETGFCETQDVETRLRDLGWVRRNGECNCGCEPGQNRNCVVVYWENGQVGHAAIFDHIRCDWGSKLGAGLPVARFRRPEDYYRGADRAADAEMRFSCPKGANEPGGPGVAPTYPPPPPPPSPPAHRQNTDEEQHASAHDP